MLRSCITVIILIKILYKSKKHSPVIFLKKVAIVTSYCVQLKWLFMHRLCPVGWNFWASWWMNAQFLDMDSSQYRGSEFFCLFQNIRNIHKWNIYENVWKEIILCLRHFTMKTWVVHGAQSHILTAVNFSESQPWSQIFKFDNLVYLLWS